MGHAHWLSSPRAHPPLLFTQGMCVDGDLQIVVTRLLDAVVRTALTLDRTIPVSVSRTALLQTVWSVSSAPPPCFNVVNAHCVVDVLSE